MTSIHKIQTKHLNEHSTLYGGQLLEWIDNYCLAKTEKYRKKNREKFVTKSMHCDFLLPAYLGDLVIMRIVDERVGNTSVSFDYQVERKDEILAKGVCVFVKIVNDQKAKIN